MSVGRTCIVTGVAGFIGSRLASRLVADGFTVIGVDDLSSGSLRNIPHEVDLINFNLAEKNKFRLLPRRCDYILHLAGQSSGEISFDNPKLDLEKNVVSTLNLIEYGLETSASKLVYASSMAVYGSCLDRSASENDFCLPLSCYGAGKLASENYLRIFSQKMSSISLRMFNVYGPGQDLTNLRQGMVSIFIAQALENGRVLVKGSLDRYRDFIHVDDVVEAWVRAALCSREVTGAINVGTGVRTSVGELLEKICRFLPGITYECEGYTAGDQHGVYANLFRLKTELGYTPKVQLSEGIEDFIRWCSTDSKSRRIR